MPMAEFEAFYAVEAKRLTRFVMRHGASVHEAADAAQSAFAQALMVWETIRQPRAWLRRVAIREYYHRALSLEDPKDAIPDHTGALSAAAEVELREQTHKVLGALATLPARQRQVMAWRYDGFSPAEIAEALDLDPAAVRQNLHKARGNLKKLLGIAEGGTR
jgi:RNA polymerase sigma-70 factor (ECF subfamily)